MDWLSENWLWIAFGTAFVWMHLRMHKGHGGSHGCGSHAGHDNHEEIRTSEGAAETDHGIVPPR